jgi:hypothetical protein
MAHINLVTALTFVRATSATVPVVGATGTDNGRSGFALIWFAMLTAIALAASFFVTPTEIIVPSTNSAIVPDSVAQ